MRRTILAELLVIVISLLDSARVRAQAPLKPPLPQGSTYYKGRVVSQIGVGVIGCTSEQYIKGDASGCGTPSATAPAAPIGSYQINQDGTHLGSAPNKWIFGPGLSGAVCNDVTDDTAAFNTLLANVYAAGGGIIEMNGTCLISGAITLPNNGISPNPLQPTIRITGSGGAANGSLISSFISSPSVIDMRYSAPYGKILSLGQGKLEIDHLTFINGGTDCSPFIYSTNTTLHVHDNFFSGTVSGSSACNDAVILGGTTTTVLTLDPTDAFQGYGTIIQGNFFDKIRRGVYARKFANANVIKDNTWSTTCGADNTAAALEFDGGANNSMSGNLFELANYVYGVKINGVGADQLFFGDTFWDAGVSTLFSIYEEPMGAVGVIGGDFTSPVSNLTPYQGSGIVTRNDYLALASETAKTFYADTAGAHLRTGSGVWPIFDFVNISTSTELGQILFDPVGAEMDLAVGGDNTGYSHTKLRIRNTGGLQIISGTRPSCDNTINGTIYYQAGNTGIADIYSVCSKDSSDAYSWIDFPSASVSIPKTCSGERCYRKDTDGTITEWSAPVAMGSDDYTVTLPYACTSTTHEDVQTQAVYPTGDSGYTTVVTGSITTSGFIVHQNNTTGMGLTWHVTCD